MSFSLQVAEWVDEANTTQEVVYFNVTSLRIHPDYVYYYVHWTRWAGWSSAHSGTYSYKSLLLQILSLSLKVLDKTDNH